MPEPRDDMFPEAENIKEADIPEEDIIKEDPEIEPESTPVQPESKKGDKTPPNLLLESLQKEREKRKNLEIELKQLKESSSEDDILSDEGKLLNNEIKRLNNKIASIEEKSVENQVLNKYPEILDKLEDFEEFKGEYPGVSLDKVAKLFVSEKGLKPTGTKPKGLERPTSGNKSEQTQKIKASDVDRLMQGDERKFIKLVRSGALDGDNIING